MILITMTEHLIGSSSTIQGIADICNKIPVKGFITDLPLGTALERIFRYSILYNERYTTLMLSFKLISVSTIPDLSSNQIACSGAEFVEDLPQDISDFE